MAATILHRCKKGIRYKCVCVCACVCVCVYARTRARAQLLSHIQLFVTAWTVARQAPLSMQFSKREYWSGFPCPRPGDVPDPEIEPTYPASAALQADSLATEPPGKPPNNLSLTYYLLKHPVPKYSLVVSY